MTPAPLRPSSFTLTTPLVEIFRFAQNDNVGLATALDAGQRPASFSPADAGRTTGSRV